MDKDFKRILEEAKKTNPKFGRILTGGNKYINPIRKEFMTSKKTTKKKD